MFRRPDLRVGVYAEREVLRRGDRITLVAFPDVSLEVDELLPAEPVPPYWRDV